MSVLPDSLTNLVVPQNTLPPADPSESVLYLAQMGKALADNKDANYKRIANDEMKFFKMAAAIIGAPPETIATSPEAFAAIRLQFGGGVEGCKKLAEVLREIAKKKQAEQILKQVTENSYATDEVNPAAFAANSISQDMEANKSIFHY